VAWFVSNCHESNTRKKYTQELQKYIPVDIYGKCGTKKLSTLPNNGMLRDAQSRIQILSCFRERQLQGLHYREVLFEQP
jgi:hypothetical protein